MVQVYFSSKLWGESGTKSQLWEIWFKFKHRIMWEHWYKIKKVFKIMQTLVKNKNRNQNWGKLWYKIKTGIKIVGNCSKKSKTKSKIGKNWYKIKNGKKN